MRCVIAWGVLLWLPGGAGAFCTEPPVARGAPAEGWAAGPQPEPWPEGARTEAGVSFAAPGVGTVTVREAVLDPDEEARIVRRTFGDTELVLVARGVRAPRPAHRRQTVLVMPTNDLHDFETVAEVGVREGRVYYDDIRVETSDEHRPAGHASTTDFASEPLTCGEMALVQFGPIPAGMPSFKWPINKGCTGSDCIAVRRGYVEAVHATWRLTQMMDIVANQPSASRSWVWNRPGVNGAGVAASSRTSPRYYFGSYKSDRFATIRTLFSDHLKVLRSARMDGIDLRLKCPNKKDNGGNACFASGTWGHHLVKGWVNICPNMWNELDDTGLPSEIALSWINHTVAHEFYHHHWAHISGVGWRMLQDRLRHYHGKLCIKSSLQLMTTNFGVTPTVDARVAHLASYHNENSDGCGHRRVLLRNIDSYNTAARYIGERIRAGNLVSWPLPAPPTPQPPVCVDGEGCLCLTTGPQDTPDGDYSADHYCSGPLQCVRTAFGAGNEVGVCTGCDDERGIGCPCRDGVADCDVGTCWGDDTQGEDASWGRCYVEPPTFDCLVDCDALLNTATCLPDHPGWARCVPAGTGLPEAANCWESQRRLDPNGDGCVSTPECGEADDCHAIGYPPYFRCDDHHRCVPDP